MLNEELVKASAGKPLDLSHDWGQITTDPAFPAFSHPNIGTGIRFPGPWNEFFAVSKPINLQAGTYEIMVQYLQAWANEMASQLIAFPPSAIAAGAVPYIPSPPPASPYSAPGSPPAPPGQYPAGTKYDYTILSKPIGVPPSKPLDYLMTLGAPLGPYLCPH
jgi:hypothetical protein